MASTLLEALSEKTPAHGLISQSLERFSAGIRAFQEAENLLEQARDAIPAPREPTTEEEEEVALLEAEADRAEKELEELTSRVDVLEEALQDQPDDIADAIQTILDSTSDYITLRARMEGLKDALRREARKPIPNDYEGIDRSELIAFAFQYSPRAA